MHSNRSDIFPGRLFGEEEGKSGGVRSVSGATGTGDDQSQRGKNLKKENPLKSCESFYVKPILTLYIEIFSQLRIIAIFNGLMYPAEVKSCWILTK